MLQALIPILGGIGQRVADSLFPNPEDELKRQELTNQLNSEILKEAASLQKAGLENVKAEIQGESWIQRNWRPWTMVFFVFLVASYWFGYTTEFLEQDIVNRLFDLLEIGLGGYVIGRTGEKMVKTAAEAYKSKHQ